MAGKGLEVLLKKKLIRRLKRLWSTDEDEDGEGKCEMTREEDEGYIEECPYGILNLSPFLILFSSLRIYLSTLIPQHVNDLPSYHTAIKPPVHPRRYVVSVRIRRPLEQETLYLARFRTSMNFR